MSVRTLIERLVDLESDPSNPMPNTTGEAIDEIERLRKLNSDYKHQIHTLRSRLESLTRQMEGLRAGRQSTPVVRHFDGLNQEPQED